MRDDEKFECIVQLTIWFIAIILAMLFSTIINNL